MMKIPDSMMFLTCGHCGHMDDFETFCRVEINGDLPPGVYQCPRCRLAWRMEKHEAGRWLDSGLWVPPGRRATRIPTFL